MTDFYTGKKFECPTCKRMLSKSSIYEHRQPGFNCQDLILHKNGARRGNPARRITKAQKLEKKLKRKKFGKTELIYWDEKNRWTLPEHGIKITKSRLGSSEFSKRAGPKVYGGKTKKWKGEGIAFTEQATVELWMRGEVDVFKTVLNRFASITDIKVVMDSLGFPTRNSFTWTDAYHNISEDYPIERFRDVTKGSGHGGEMSNFRVTDDEKIRRITILDNLPDNCGKEIISSKLGGSARKKMYCWVLGNYPEIDRLIPSIPSSTLAVARNRQALMTAFDERGWTRNTRTKHCCEPKCNEKSVAWYRCKSCYSSYIDKAHKKILLGD